MGSEGVQYLLYRRLNRTMVTREIATAPVMLLIVTTMILVDELDGCAALDVDGEGAAVLAGKRSVEEVEKEREGELDCNDGDDEEANDGLMNDEVDDKEKEMYGELLDNKPPEGELSDGG